MKKTIKIFLILFCTISMFTFLKANAQEGGHQHSQHGFILLGEEQKYLYHLAKYNSPHQYMAIFKIDLYDEHYNPLDLQVSRDHLLSALSTDPFLLPQLADGSTNQFSIAIFSGYLRSEEKVKIYDNINVIIREVITFEEVFPGSYSPIELKYVIFGERDDYYLAHSIGGAPNYEQILGIDVDNNHIILPGQEVFIAGRVDQEPLPEGAFSSGTIFGYFEYNFNFFVRKQFILERRTLSGTINKERQPQPKALK